MTTNRQLADILIGKNQQLSTEQANRIISTITESMSNFLAQGKRIEIRNFGAISVRESIAKTVRNPKTNETVAREQPIKRIYFRASKTSKKSASEG